MKKLLIVVSLTILSLGITSCTCECIGPSNTGSGDKVCRVEYENAYGQGTWPNYEAAQKSYGWICK